MHLKKILRRHWLATTILFCSLGLVAWYSYHDYHPTNSPIVENKPVITAATDNKKQEIKKEPPEKKEITNTSTKPITGTTEEKAFDQVVDTKFVINGQSYTVHVIPGTSVYDAMRILDGNNISIKFKNYSGLGYFVDGINGQNSDTLKGQYWIYYINGAKAQVGISSYNLNKNDIITWKYEAQE